MAIVSLVQVDWQTFEVDYEGFCPIGHGFARHHVFPFYRIVNPSRQSSQGIGGSGFAHLGPVSMEIRNHDIVGHSRYPYA